MTALCPVGGKPGKRVGPVTVQSLVLEEHLPEGEGGAWFYCDAADCDVVYFDAAGRTLARGALKVRVGGKEKGPPRTVCYCFGHTIEGIRDEVQRTGRSTVAASITARIRAGECRCEILNPKGTCCLGDVNEAVASALSVSRGARGEAPRHDHIARAPSADDCCAVPRESGPPTAIPPVSGRR